MDNVLVAAQAVLLTTPARWMKLTEKIAPDLLGRPPAPGEWSVVDCLCHLLDTEIDVFPVRVRAFLDRKDIPDFDPATQSHGYAGIAPGRLAAEFARLRSQNLVLFEQLSPRDLARTAQHSALGPVTLGQLLHEWAAHDLMHTVQAEQALMQPFIAGAGPWRPFFADHDVDAAAAR